jgi:hypothetical protein
LYERGPNGGTFAFDFVFDLVAQSGDPPFELLVVAMTGGKDDVNATTEYLGTINALLPRANYEYLGF